jgi:hypothetical protein
MRADTTGIVVNLATVFAFFDQQLAFGAGVEVRLVAGVERGVAQFAVLS